jgi:hypothetical protein
VPGATGVFRPPKRTHTRSRSPRYYVHLSRPLLAERTLKRVRFFSLSESVDPPTVKFARPLYAYYHYCYYCTHVTHNHARAQSSTLLCAHAPVYPIRNEFVRARITVPRQRLYARVEIDQLLIARRECNKRVKAFPLARAKTRTVTQL